MADCSTEDVGNATECSWNGSRNNTTVEHSDCLGCTGVHYGVISVTSLLLLLLGTTGNITAFVLHIKQKPRTSTNVLLASLGIADAVTLSFLMLFTLTYSLFGVDLDVLVECKVLWFLVLGGMHMSGLVTAFVSIERAIVSFRPLSQENRKPRTAYAEVIGAVIFIVLFDGYQISLRVNPERITVYDHCLVPDWGNLLYRNLELSFMVGLVICVSITNVAIICKIQKQGKVNPLTGSVLAQTKWLAIQKKTTIVCVAISFTFLVSCVFSFVGQRTPFREYDWFNQFLLQIPLFINHSVNFYLYSVAGKQFRKKLKSMFQFLWCVTRRNRNRVNVRVNVRVIEVAPVSTIEPRRP